MDNTIQYPLYRDELFSQAKRISDYEKLKTLHRSVSWMINHIEDSMVGKVKPKNPRQDILQHRDIRNHQRLLRQKERLEERMVEFEKQIQEDINHSKNKL